MAKTINEILNLNVNDFDHNFSVEDSDLFRSALLLIMADM